MTMLSLTCRTLESVPELTLKHFKSVAEKLTEEKDVVSIISAALAIISGNADMKPRSLLSSREVC
jgi:ATP-dependent RNA helicase DDX21